MSGIAKYVWGALLIAIAAHLIIINAAPVFLMDRALAKLSGNGAHYNTWRQNERVTPETRTIVRPSPDFAYAACPFDLKQGPVSLRVVAWGAYWSLSLYAANSDNFFVIDDREARNGAAITLIRAGKQPPDDAGQVVESPSQRGIAIIRRLAPDGESFAAAQRVAQDDDCASFVAPGA